MLCEPVQGPGRIHYNIQNTPQSHLTALPIICCGNPPTNPRSLCEGDLWGDKRNATGHSSFYSLLYSPHPFPTLAREGKGYPLPPPPQGGAKGSQAKGWFY